VNTVGDDAFGITLIPHTLAASTFGERRAGDPVNLEVDLVARYVERLASAATLPPLP
jgi:riboflavin synthase